ncbi:MAG: hypothetical protein BEN19_08930 [Epulopiscium sp. Nuni2H_MBin003]|nr:MAG: hypothetical protein BEN19_08930 [Epulopiscium sp. Nuni2H_MBin003]
MKKIIISSSRHSREHLCNPYTEISLADRMTKSKCIDYVNNSHLVDLGNGYSKIVPIDVNKLIG